MSENRSTLGRHMMSFMILLKVFKTCIILIEYLKKKHKMYKKTHLKITQKKPHIFEIPTKLNNRKNRI